MADLCDGDYLFDNFGKSAGKMIVDEVIEEAYITESYEQKCRNFWLNKNFSKRKKNSYKLAKLPEKSGWITDILKEKNIKHEEINQIVDDKNIGFWIIGYLPDVNEDIVYNLEMGSFLDGKKDGV